MASEGTVSSSVENTSEGLKRLRHWVLLRGNRIAIAGLVVVAVVLSTAGFIVAGLIDVGPDSLVPTLLGGGLTSGVATLLTITLSINQLILSRVFGSPNDLRERLTGTLEFRGTIENIAEEPSSPNDPAAFLSLLATTLAERSRALQTALDESDWTPPPEIATAAQDLVDYGENIDSGLEEHTEIVDVLDVILGKEYARNMTAVNHLRSVHDDGIPEEARLELRAIEELIESIAITRQFLKTLSLQQDLARLSRLVVYTGILALAVVVWLTLVYRTGSATIPSRLLPVVVSVGLGIIFAPFAVFVSFILRAATIGSRTVSVGPFIPARE